MKKDVGDSVGIKWGLHNVWDNLRFGYPFGVVFLCCNRKGMWKTNIFRKLLKFCGIKWVISLLKWCGRRIFCWETFFDNEKSSKLYRLHVKPSHSWTIRKLSYRTLLQINYQRNFEQINGKFTPKILLSYLSWISSI